MICQWYVSAMILDQWNSERRVQATLTWFGSIQASKHAQRKGLRSNFPQTLDKFSLVTHLQEQIFT